MVVGSARPRGPRSPGVRHDVVSGRTERVHRLSVALVHDCRCHLASGSIRGRQPARPQIPCHRAGDQAFTAGFLHVWALGVATGLAYYVVPKASGQPLANRQLARVGFWSLLFGAVWMGPAQLVGGPAPEWLQGVASVLGLAIPVASVANAVNLALTVGPEWKNLGRRPILASAVAGSAMAAIAGIATAIAGFRSAAVLVAFTPFWDGVIYLLLFGAVMLLFASFAWLAIPTLVGRMIDSQPRGLEVGSKDDLCRRRGLPVPGDGRAGRRVRMGRRRLQRTGRKYR